MSNFRLTIDDTKPNCGACGLEWPYSTCPAGCGYPIEIERLERELADARPVMDMLLLDGNVGPELKGAAKLRAIIDALIEARTAIADHNTECDSLCGDRKRCGYEQYRSYMSCTECPKNWKIET